MKNVEHIMYSYTQIKFTNFFLWNFEICILFCQIR